MAARRILVTGASGFLGSNLCAHFGAAGWEVWAAWGSREPGLKGVTARRLDVCDRAAVAALVEACRPEAVVHAAAMADPDACAADPGRARLVNVTGASALAEACAKRGIRLAFTSTDLVFEGSRPFYREEDPPSPLGAYARSKAEAERAVLSWQGATPLVLRCSLMYGWGRGAAKGRNFAEKWLRAFLTGGRVPAFTDQWRSPLWVADACALIEQALAAGAEGLLHLGGPERSSRHDFALALAREFSFPESAVIPAHLKDAAFKDPRPADASLDISRLKALTGLEPLGVAAGLKAMHAALETL